MLLSEHEWRARDGLVKTGVAVVTIANDGRFADDPDVQWMSSVCRARPMGISGPWMHRPQPPPDQAFRCLYPSRLALI